MGKLDEKHLALVAEAQISRIIKDPSSLRTPESREAASRAIYKGISFLEDPEGIREVLKKTVLWEAFLAIEEEANGEVARVIE